MKHICIVRVKKMGKLKFVIRRLFDMNYKAMFNKIDEIHKETGINRIKLFFDVIYCGFKYQAGYMDYWLFKMYELSKDQRKTILTRGINNSLIKKYNNYDYKCYFENKDKFNEKFKKYVKRDWLYLDDYKSFSKFISNKDTIMAKPTIGTHGDGIIKISIKDYTPRKLYNYLKKKNLLLLEEVANQHKDLNKLHPVSVNTIRAVTLTKGKKTTLFAAYLRIGNNKIVDNFNNDGLVVPINIKTGIIEYPALDKKGNLYDKHPLTGTKIIGFKIPKWKETLKMLKEIAQIVPQIGYIGWDVCITPNGPILIEGNEYPGHDVYQLPPHRTDGIGLVPRLKEAEGEINEN